MQELNRLRQQAPDDPAMQRQIQELVTAMEHLDLRRFPGNPAMIDELHQRLITGVTTLELQLRRNLDEKRPGQIRSTDPSAIPSGYKDAVAEYFRRLSALGGAPASGSAVRTRPELVEGRARRSSFDRLRMSADHPDVSRRVRLQPHLDQPREDAARQLLRNRGASVKEDRRPFPARTLADNERERRGSLKPRPASPRPSTDPDERAAGSPVFRTGPGAAGQVARCPAEKMADITLKAIAFDWGHTLMDERRDEHIPIDERLIHLMPGVADVLPQLTRPLAVWANTRIAAEAAVWGWLERAALAPLFQWVITSVDAGVRKPAPGFFQYTLARCGLTRDDVLFVGNQLNSDITGAEAFGIRTVWLRGPAYRSLDDAPCSASPTHTIETLYDLPALLNHLQA